MVGECRAGRGRTGGREVEEESAGRWKKWGKIMQQCLILCNRKWAKGRKPKKERWGGSRKYKVREAGDLNPLPPYPPPPPHMTKRSISFYLSRRPCLALKYYLTHCLQNIF